MNTLIKLSIALFLGLLSWKSVGQDFSKYDGQSGVTSVVINKTMFKLMSAMELDVDDPEAKKMIHMIENLDNIQIFTTKNAALKKSFLEDTKAYVKNMKLDELMRVSEEDELVEIYVKSGANSSEVKQLFMHVNSGGEDVIIIIEGLIDLKEIGELANKFNLPGSTNLQNIEN
ncbi:MAG: DUF4252 domain-containing protein [Flavobacteriaceae bacterium]|nr:DUF4252 domain-containing protein [Flavobacteriaceae bacterium]